MFRILLQAWADRKTWKGPLIERIIKPRMEFHIVAPAIEEGPGLNKQARIFYSLACLTPRMGGTELHRLPCLSVGAWVVVADQDALFISCVP